ncbi:ABC transporter permease [Rhodococcus sp. NPDC058521]|uniref:ABC transporter permease n=1 Tax=Rhodococcus sp. NPDC058521 TaxID=3346536 RepID=UPI00365E41F8
MTSTMNDTRRWWSIVGVLVGLELRQRLRTTRWKVTLAIAFAAVSLIVFGSMYVSMSPGSADYRDWAQNLYAIVMAVELFLGIVLAPTLSATAINGDRKDATLAVVQATPISNWQLTIGKLIGNWVSCLALVAVASPYLVWGIIEAPYGIGRGVLGALVLCLLFACFCGIGLGFSALTARPAGSAVLTQATVFFLILGLPAVFGLLYSTTAQDHRVAGTEYTASANPSDYPTCRDVEKVETFYHTERTWWLLAPNPFLVLPDVVATNDFPSMGSSFAGSTNTDPTVVSSIAQLLSSARTGPYVAAPTCADQRSSYSTDPAPREQSFYRQQEAHERGRIGDSWYLGLLANIVFGGIGVTIAARRLRVPAGKLPKGVRIA